MVGLAPGGFTVRGQDAAVAAARELLSGAVPHAILIVGPPSVGKATFALDLATALLCTAPDPGDRPCRACRGCRLVANGDHPDLHRLLTSGSGGQIRLHGDVTADDPPDPGSVRYVVGSLRLHANEGGRRVVIADHAERMNEDGQNYLLKTLEEPPPGVVFLLCASDEERLLPTVRSRCARLRFGPVGTRDIETLLGERGLADAPVAARLARIAGGRPGVAIALAAAPDAIAARDELVRTLLDALGSSKARRLALIRELVTLVGPLAALAESPEAPVQTTAAGGAVAGRGVGGRSRGRAGASVAMPETMAAPVAIASPPEPDGSADPEAEGASGGKGKASAAERRRAAIALIGLWRDLARDLLVVRRGGRTLVADPGLLEELERTAAVVDEPALVAFLDRAERTARLIQGNANPELALDVLVLAWPGTGVPDGR